MRDLPRFFLPLSHLSAESVEFQEADAIHLQRVLRLNAGDRVYVLDGQGACFLVELVSIEKRSARGHILSRVEAGGELPVPVTLVQGLPKGEKFDWILQKATELGVMRIQPTITRRSVVKVASERSSEKLRRWDAIVREAAEQCERARVPEISPPCALDEWLAIPKAEGVMRLACLERADAPSIWKKLASSPDIRAIEVIVGPEGGFAPEEHDALLYSGAQGVSLGRRILRTETASLAALSAIALALET